MCKGGFNIGDKFVYFSKYGGTVVGVVETILEINTLFNNIWFKEYLINEKYKTTEINHFTSQLNENEIESLKKIENLISSKL